MNKNTVNLLGSHTFEVTPHYNGGESLTLITDFYDGPARARSCRCGGDAGEIYSNQTLRLQSYGNSATMELSSNQFTPEILMSLSIELNQFRNNIQEKQLKKVPSPSKIFAKSTIGHEILNELKKLYHIVPINRGGQAAEPWLLVDEYLKQSTS